MVDVGEKPATRRTAVAQARVVMSKAAFSALARGALAKGDALAVARIAGIQAAKRTSEIVPLCHPIPLDGVSVDVVLERRAHAARITTRASTSAKTGVEMEALTAAAAAALALYDMIKGIDRSGRIEAVALLEKTGGRSGPFRARKPGSGMRRG